MSKRGGPYRHVERTPVSYGAKSLSLEIPAKFGLLPTEQGVAVTPEELTLQQKEQPRAFFTVREWVYIAVSGVELLLSFVLFSRVKRPHSWCINVYNSFSIWQPTVPGHECFDLIPGTTQKNVCLVSPSPPSSTGFDPVLITSFAILLSGTLHAVNVGFMIKHRRSNVVQKEPDANIGTYIELAASQAIMIPVPLALVGVSDIHHIISSSLLVGFGTGCALVREHFMAEELSRNTIKYGRESPGSERLIKIGVMYNVVGWMGHIVVWVSVFDKMVKAVHEGHPPSDIPALVSIIFLMFAFTGVIQALAMASWIRTWFYRESGKDVKILDFQIVEYCFLSFGFCMRFVAFAVIGFGTMMKNEDLIQNQWLVSSN